MTPLRVSSLDADCLLLSNQAKLEAKLESSHAAIISKLDPAFSYHTPTQECLVAKDGDETCTNLYVEIPADFANGKTVTGTLKVGPAVTSIGRSAFAYTGVTELDISEATALQTIGDYAFYSNTELTGTLKVGPAVTSIGRYAFGHTGLTELDISDATALTTIETNAFYNSPLAGLTFALQNISDYAFYSNTELTGTLKVGPAVTSIGDYAFLYTDLKELDISEATALTTIGDWAFSYNAQLTGTLKVGPAVTSIGAYAFRDTKLTGINLYEATALQTIGNYAFYNNAQLTGTLKVGPAVTSIGYDAFRDTDLTGLDLSDATALQTIGDGAFFGTPLSGQTVLKADGTSIRLT